MRSWLVYILTPFCHEVILLLIEKSENFDQLTLCATYFSELNSSRNSGSLACSILLVHGPCV